MNLNGILTGSEDPQRLVAYYIRLSGEPGWAGGDFRGWQLGTGYVTVGPHDQVRGRNPQPGRLIWNLLFSPMEWPSASSAEQATCRAPRGVRRREGQMAMPMLGAFMVADVEAAVAELRGKGVSFEEYGLPGLKTVNGIAELGGSKGAWFKDPEGNILSVVQPPPA
jgi:hypothetical protein